MPLVHSASKEAVGANIRREMEAGKPQRQAVAIALSVQRRAGGGKPKPRRYKDNAKVGAK
jgi:hypothetical protein